MDLLIDPLSIEHCLIVWLFELWLIDCLIDGFIDGSLFGCLINWLIVSLIISFPWQKTSTLPDSCTVGDFIALVDCAGRYEHVDARWSMISQFLARHTAADLPLDVYSGVTYVPSAVILFAHKVCFIEESLLDSVRYALIMKAIIRGVATENQMAFDLAQAVVNGMFVKVNWLLLAFNKFCFLSCQFQIDNSFRSVRLKLKIMTWNWTTFLLHFFTISRIFSLFFYFNLNNILLWVIWIPVQFALNIDVKL